MTVSARELNLKARSLQIKGEDLVKRLRKAVNWHQEQIKKADLGEIVRKLAIDVNDWKTSFIKMVDTDDDSTAGSSNLISPVTMAKLWALETDVSVLWNEVHAISLLLNLLPKTPVPAEKPENEVTM